MFVRLMNSRESMLKLAITSYILWCMEKYRQGLRIMDFAHPANPPKKIRGSEFLSFNRNHSLTTLVISFTGGDPQYRMENGSEDSSLANELTDIPG